MTINGATAPGTGPDNPGYSQPIQVLGGTAGMTYYGPAGGYVNIVLTGGNNLALNGGGTYSVGAQG